MSIGNVRFCCASYKEAPHVDPCSMALSKEARTPVAANGTQVGGSHYKGFTIQPWDAIVDWGLDYFEGNVVKYIARSRKKGGLEDLRKAQHYLNKLVEMREKMLAEAIKNVESQQ